MYNNREKLKIQSWENLVTDGQMDKSDFIGRWLTNLELPPTKNLKNIQIDLNQEIKKEHLNEMEMTWDM